MFRRLCGNHGKERMLLHHLLKCNAATAVRCAQPSGAPLVQHTRESLLHQARNVNGMGSW